VVSSGNHWLVQARMDDRLGRHCLALLGAQILSGIKRVAS